MLNLETETVDTDTVDKADAAGRPHEPDDQIDAPVDAARRPVGLWDVAGLLLFGFLMLGAVSAAPVFVGGWFYRPAILPWLTGFAGLVTATVIGHAIRRERPPVRALPGRLTEIWRDSPGHWPAFALGAGMALPLVGLYVPTLFMDSDSMRIIAAIRYVQRGNLDFFVETQDSFGPHLVFGPLLAIVGAAPLRLVGIFALQVLVGLLAWMARRLSGSMSAAALAALAALSLPALVERTLYLPMYTTMLAFGSLGSWLAYRVIAQNAGWRYAFGAGLCFALAQETHLIGQLFVGAPLVLLVVAPNLRRGLGNLLRVYGATLLFFLPRLIVNVSEGGLSLIHSNRTDYWITEGYLRRIQIDYWGYAGLGETRLTYLLLYPQRLMNTLGDFGWVALLFAVIAIIGLRGRARWFALGWLGLVVAAMTSKTIQPTPRYFAPLWPGVALLAGLAAAALLRDRRTAKRVVGVVAAVALACVSFNTLRSTALKARELTDRVEAAEYLAAGDIIADDGKGVIGGRAHRLLLVDPDIPVYGGQFLSEEEFVTFLTWPSDEKVIDMLDQRDIGWVMLRGADEVRYHNAWLVPAYGVPARHHEMVAESSAFCPVFAAQDVVLYKLGSC